MDIIMGRRPAEILAGDPDRCSIKIVSASHNLRQLRCDKIVSSMAE
jgi:hypothetical protein